MANAQTFLVACFGAKSLKCSVSRQLVKSEARGLVRKTLMLR